MEHISFVLRIDPLDEEAYMKRHEHVYPELEQAFGQAGIHRYHIYYHEGTLFAYMMVDNFEKAMKRLADHPANVKWQAYMADLLLPWENGENVKIIKEAYSYVK
ncbi:L-rhamnose mutarotase [Paenibacillus sedimenti]|uniref:L-rhamnose mutarotase n=1 Tax=Paenibacillus sedimenti TaxID=2770274 RepID=A0A926QIZ6_9BACL|nr:L-rhamnose mutarotase [Paenibacillus sedimenti]MBD0380004.1 L-rhamnose mutarotase [Paenibacillus sedimenti]